MAGETPRRSKLNACELVIPLQTGCQSTTPIRVTPHIHNTYTPAMSHAWGRSVMIVVMCWLLGLIRQLGEHVSIYSGLG